MAGRIFIKKLSKEIICYFVFGVLTTLVNIMTYAVFTVYINPDYKAGTTVAWIFAVLFAFITNKLFVFNSKQLSPDVVLRELGPFLLARILSYGLDIFAMILLVGILGANDLASKVLSNILVATFNYIASKFFIFKGLAEK